jgi:hypothetical protein
MLVFRGFRPQENGENNSSENGAIMYDCVEFEDYLGNVGLTF